MATGTTWQKAKMNKLSHHNRTRACGDYARFAEKSTLDGLPNGGERRDGGAKPVFEPEGKAALRGALVALCDGVKVRRISTGQAEGLSRSIGRVGKGLSRSIGRVGKGGRYAAKSCGGDGRRLGACIVWAR